MLSEKDMSSLTLRSLLSNLLHNEEVNAILIGENHNSSPTIQALLANIDLLLNSERQIIFITESINQDANQEIENVVQGQKKLTEIDDFKKPELELYNLCRLLTNNGIHIYGAENSESNPFIDAENIPANIKAMQDYAKDPKRVSIPNIVFAKLINSVMQPNTIVIFVGGAAHPISVKKSGKDFDSGIQGRVKNSRSLYLLYTNENQMTQKYNYTNKDYDISGQYDFYVGTNDGNLYKNSFLESNDPVKLFIFHLDNLIKSYQEHFSNLHVAVDLNYKCIKKAFIESMKDRYGVDLEFKYLDKLMTRIIKKGEKKEKNYFTTFKTPSYSTNKLEEAIQKDCKRSKFELEVITTQVEKNPK